MKIPKKIYPDRIKDAIIEVKYYSNLPFEVIVGIFYQSLDDTYVYTNRPLGKQQISSSLPINLPQEITLSLGNQSLFYNDKIQIQLQPNSIIFNCLNNYISWTNYKPEIEKVLLQLEKANVIEYYNRIGIRYISEYPSYDLQDCVKFSFTFGMPNIKSDTYLFRSEFNWDNLRIILNLSNRLPVLRQEDTHNQASVVPISLIDIDVISDNFNEKELEILMSKIDEAQLKEKEIFFNLLKEDFLLSLNPEY